MGSHIKDNYFRVVNALLISSILLACLSINLPTAWLTLSISMIALSFFLSGKFNLKYHCILQNEGATTAIIFFIFCCIGMLYSSGEFAIKIKILLKYLKLLLIPLIIASVTHQKIRSYGLKIFLYGSVVAVCISYAKWLQILPMDLGLHDISSPDHGFVFFKNRIAHNIILSFAMYIMLIEARRENGWMKYIWTTLALLTFFDVMHLVNGRSGQIICLGLLAYFFIKTFGKKALLTIFIVCSLGFIFKAAVTPYLPERLMAISQEIQDTEQKKELTSSGIRLEMYKSTSRMILASPIWGHGVGSLRQEFSRLKQGNADVRLDRFDNPHNQFLLTLFELGIVGFLVLMYMFLKHWAILKNNTHKNEAYLAEIIEGLVLTMIIGSLFNSLLLDASEGRFYCVMAGLLLSAYVPRKKNHA